MLVARLLDEDRLVQPIYVRFGLVWEDIEQAHLRRFLATLPSERTAPLVTLELPIGDLYGEHWSVSGKDVPGARSPDDAVYLPGRNVLLLSKTSVWCALNGFLSIALGTLDGNPFPDSTAGFFGSFGALAGTALSVPLEVVTPFARMSKAEVLESGRDLELHHTFSCIEPQRGIHCGRCNKCAERKRAFGTLGLQDKTPYDER